MKVRIHVNQHNIKRNLKLGTDDPVVTVKTYKDNFYGHRVEIQGGSSLVYPDKPLSCGARVWVETESKVKVFDRNNELIAEVN